jgi:hypothetical protein
MIKMHESDVALIRLKKWTWTHYYGPKENGLWHTEF